MKAELHPLNRAENQLLATEVRHMPEVNVVSVNSSFLQLEIVNEKFQNCPNIKFELQVKTGENGLFESVENFTSLELMVDRYSGRVCRIR